VATGVRPGPECRCRPCPAPNGVHEGEPLRGRGHGSTGTDGCPAREYGQAPAAVELEKAFNFIARPAILEALEHLCPSMMQYVRQAFQPAPLLFGRKVIWSTRGVQQGDPLGPFLFAAGIQAALDALPSHY